ncbi:MAG: nucleoside 2-deoxyribosyltransferase [Candidatus Heimdallarchaeota archaeon]|nr:nucleoside 2-deoxyribosyltransferase [Candidatus Heimdallarchaeota archaeon]
MKKVFLGQAMDYLDPQVIVDNHKRFTQLLEPYGFKVISTFDPEERKTLHKELSIEKLAEVIVERDLAILEDCDMCLFDLSDEQRPYVGCLFEIAYAYKMNKEIFVYTGNSEISKRLWLIYHTTFMSNKIEEVINEISKRR